MALEGIRASKVELLLFTLEMHGYKANMWYGVDIQALYFENAFFQLFSHVSVKCE